MTDLNLMNLEIHFIARQLHNMGGKPQQEELMRYISEKGRCGCYKIHVPKSAFRQRYVEDIMEELRGAFNLMPNGYKWLNDEERLTVANWIREEGLVGA